MLFDFLAYFIVNLIIKSCFSGFFEIDKSMKSFWVIDKLDCGVFVDWKFSHVIRF